MWRIKRTATMVMSSGQGGHGRLFFCATSNLPGVRLSDKGRGVKRGFPTGAWGYEDTPPPPPFPPTKA